MTAIVLQSPSHDHGGAGQQPILGGVQRSMSRAMIRHMFLPLRCRSRSGSVQKMLERQGTCLNFLIPPYSTLMFGF